MASGPHQPSGRKAFATFRWRLPPGPRPCVSPPTKRPKGLCDQKVMSRVGGFSFVPTNQTAERPLRVCDFLVRAAHVAQASPPTKRPKGLCDREFRYGFVEGPYQVPTNQTAERPLRLVRADNKLTSSCWRSPPTKRPKGLCDPCTRGIQGSRSCQVPTNQTAERPLRHETAHKVIYAMRGVPTNQTAERPLRLGPRGLGWRSRGLVPTNQTAERPLRHTGEPPDTYPSWPVPTNQTAERPLRPLHHGLLSGRTSKSPPTKRPKGLCDKNM